MIYNECRILSCAIEKETGKIKEKSHTIKENS